MARVTRLSVAISAILAFGAPASGASRQRHSSTNVSLPLALAREAAARAATAVTTAKADVSAPNVAETTEPPPVTPANKPDKDTEVTATITPATTATPAAEPTAAKAVQPVLIPAFLKGSTQVNDPVVRLGDVFFGTDGPLAAAATPIATAPEPQQQLRFDAARLIEIAEQFSLDWQPRYDDEHAVVERAGTTIGTQDILSAVRPALRERGLAPAAKISLNGILKPIAVPADLAEPLTVLDVVYRPRGSSFTALIAIANGHGGQSQLRVDGHAYEMVDTPKLKVSIARDHVIGRDDLIWVKTPASKLHPNALTDSERIVGMTARRALHAGAFIRDADITPALLIKRNQLVTLRVHTRFMTLTARGKALEKGRLGDAVRIENIHSRNVIVGVVVAPGVAEITSADASLDL